MRLVRPGARMLLVAALAMLVETSCSHSPPPDVRLEARTHEGTNAVVRFHTDDHITYVTSSYAVTDSSVVIRNILREPRYYAPAEAKLYDQTLTPAPRDVTLPFELPLTRITSVDTWQPRSVGKDVGVAALVIVGIVAVALVTVLELMEPIDFGEN